MQAAEKSLTAVNFTYEVNTPLSYVAISAKYSDD